MAARRRRRKKKNGSFVLSLLTFLIVIGAIVASVTVFLKVAEVQVSGSVRYAAADIIESSGIKNGDNMFLINKFEVAEKILSEYPYIEQIKIRRKLPDTFTFEITERVAAAYVVSAGNRWLIDNNAYILERIAPDAEVKVPKISGCEVLTPFAGSPLVLKNEDQMPVLREVLTSLRYTGLTESIVRVEIDKLYDINLIYGNRFLVALGDTSQLGKKIEMLRAVIGELNDFDKGTINVSAVKEARFRPDTAIDLSEKSDMAEPAKTTEAEAEENTAAEVSDAENSGSATTKNDSESEALAESEENTNEEN